MNKKKVEEIKEEIIKLQGEFQTLITTKDNKAIKKAKSKLETLNKLIEWESLNK